MWINKLRDLNKIQKILVFILPIIFIVIILIIFYFSNTYSAKTEILVSPKKAEIFIDGKKYPSKGTFSLIPGEKEVIIKLPGFKEFNSKINFSSQKTTFLYEALDTTDDNEDYYNNNPEDSKLYDVVIESKLIKDSDQYTKDQIFKITPVRNFKLGFSASASRDEKDFNKITLTIDLMTCRDNQVENLKKVAESYFKQKGINLSKYQVKYTHCDSDQASDPNFKHDSKD